MIRNPFRMRHPRFTVQLAILQDGSPVVYVPLSALSLSAPAREKEGLATVIAFFEACRRLGERW
ncbi:MAG TPA: hypothetical protein VFL91_15235 [Thermomicrobiales bacterium]|nr:hypothetical protein [Thermomicrobiales bacterium]